MYTLGNVVWRLHIKGDLNKEMKRQIIDIYSKIDAVPLFSDDFSNRLTVIAGTPDNCTEIMSAINSGMMDIDTLGEDGHIVKSADIGGKNCIFITGLTDKAVAYGIFAFFEEVGFSFLASRVLSPETNGDTLVPGINKTYMTGSKWRGMFVSFCMVSTSIMSVSDFKNLFDSMFRMKMNRLVFYPFENEPIIDYEYKGERKVVGDISRPESGYFSYGRHWTGSFMVDELKVGGNKFNRKRVAPAEFQEVSSSDEALDTGKTFMKILIQEAVTRQIGIWIAFLPQFVSMNMSKYLRPMPRKNLHWSALVSCTDPVVKEINSNRIKNIINSYPGLEGIFIGIPEGFYEDPHAASKKYIEETLPEYSEALELQKKYWGDHWPGDELQRKHIEADIAFSKIATEAIEEVMKNESGVRVGLITVCKAYLLTKLHKILPKEVAFCDIESRSLWTHGGAPLLLFKRMEGRECSIIPRITDDGSQAGMQFNLNLYSKDGYCRSAVENGTNGLMMQTLHIKGADHNIKYLADGLWNPQINPDVFYMEYLEKVYGRAGAGSIRKAYDVLETNEEFMGGRGASNMPWNHVPPEIAVMMSFKDFNNPYHACPVSDDFIENSSMRTKIYSRSVEYLYKAAEIFKESYDSCSISGKKECLYMETRTKAYAAHLETLVTLAELYKKYIKVFAAGNTLDNIEKLLQKAGIAEKSALKTAGLFNDCVSHTTDLAVLWMINSSMVKGTEILIKYLNNIRAFYIGDEYWNEVPWSELFGTCPYPAHGIDAASLMDSSTDEPG